MRRIKNALAPVLALALLLSLTGCALRGNSKYTVVTRLETVKLCAAFREGDRAGDAVIAAMSVLAAEGELSRISREWLGEDLVTLKGDVNALENLDMELESRTFIVGYDKAHLPFSGSSSGGNPVGFDIDAAKAACGKLGWKIKFLAVDVGNAEVELKSGNVDCVWGGYAMQTGTKAVRFSPSYMENTIIIASLNGSGFRTEGSLPGATLAVSESGQFRAILESYPDTAGKPEYTVMLPGGGDDCLKSLEDGTADAVVTDIASINYHE